MTDVLVVGGGPAGASTAFQLARKGMRVRILERSRFPRAKACAECLSPQTSRLLSDMGVLDTLEPQGAQLRGMLMRAPDGTIARGDYVAEHGFRAFRDTGLAIRRELLDETLANSAVRAGSTIEHDVRVTGVLLDRQRAVTGVTVITRAGESKEIRAPLVIGADGLRSVVARRLGLARSHAWPKRIALVAHYRDVGAIVPYVELHVEADGFVGIADVGAGVTTVAAVFPSRRAAEFSSDRGGFLHRWLMSKAHLRPRFEAATRVHDAQAMGPFASHARRAWHDGALLVGDAADFFDPFTGEGIYSALRGGELVAECASAFLDATSTTATRAALRGYDETRRKEFGGKWWVERLIGASVAWPAVVNRAAKRLAERKHLADLLAGVTGDFVPASRVLGASFLGQLFFARVTSSATAAWR